jgi:hypothetical protein
MARDKELLNDRNKEIRAAYNRLKCEEQIVSYGGRKIAIRLSYQQILQLISKTYFISTRRVEYVIGNTEPIMAPIKSPSEPTAATVAARA